MELQIECEKCGKKFGSKMALEQHFNTKHIIHTEHKETKKKNNKSIEEAIKEAIKEEKEIKYIFS